jgi:serine phosphatase RsbU (regulator of sigma subunit)
MRARAARTPWCETPQDDERPTHSGWGMTAGVGEELLDALAASGTGTWRWDASTGEVAWDETLEALSGLPPGGFGRTFDAWKGTLHPEEIEWILAQVNDAIERRGSYHFEHRTIWPDGTERWLECRGQVTVDEAGAFTGTVGIAVDITDRRNDEQRRLAALDRERRLRDRVEFLAGLTDTAVAAASHNEYMRAAAAAAVPKLGDWCSIHYVPDAGDAVEIVVAHADPAKVAWANALAQRFPYNPDGETGVPKVIRSGVTEFIEHIDDALIDAVLARSNLDPVEVREILDALGVTSAITVPLVTKRGVRGAMQFVSAESGRTYDHDDVALAEVAAARIADALDNMWLTEQHQHISATLQQALLPPRLPTIPGIDVAVRYWPAGIAVQAGGDFYDVFQTSPTAWSVLIGDVCGTGPDAAAVTGIARHTVRAAARHDQDHLGVVGWLNEAMLLSDRDRFCTAVYATIEARRGGWHLTACTAGHPRPVHAHPHGCASVIGQPGSLLGVFEDVDVQVSEVPLGVGDVVVLYTDGITDLPPPHGQTEADVVDLVAEVAISGTAEEIAEAIHRSVTDRLPLAQREDDVALVVLRVTDPPPGGCERPTTERT